MPSTKPVSICILPILTMFPELPSGKFGVSSNSFLLIFLPKFTLVTEELNFTCTPTAFKFQPLALTAPQHTHHHDSAPLSEAFRLTPHLPSGCLCFPSSAGETLAIPQNSAAVTPTSLGQAQHTPGWAVFVSHTLKRPHSIVLCYDANLRLSACLARMKPSGGKAPSPGPSS